MASTSEKGHAINVANFETLITTCTGHAAAYNPVNPTIQIPQLQAKYDLAKQKLNLTEAKRGLLNTAINQRVAAFDGLEILCTKVTNAFAVSGANPLDIEDLKTINKKIQGASAKKKKQTVQKAEDQTPKEISTSQQSFDSKLNFFKNFIQYLEQKPAYNPNESELQLPKLQNKYDIMNQKNQEADQSLFNYNTAQNERNNELYNPVTGLVQTAKDVKKYVRSVFKSSSPEFHQLNSIQFTNIK